MAAIPVSRFYISGGGVPGSSDRRPKSRGEYRLRRKAGFFLSTRPSVRPSTPSFTCTFWRSPGDLIIIIIIISNRTTHSVSGSCLVRQKAIVRRGTYRDGRKTRFPSSPRLFRRRQLKRSVYEIKYLDFFRINLNLRRPPSIHYNKHKSHVVETGRCIRASKLF